MILLSAHLDRVHQSFKLSYDNGKLIGLLDNILGVMVVHHALMDEPNIARLEREGELKIWHNQQEEWGGLDETCPKLTQKDFVIVVDVCAGGEKYAGLDFTIENCYGMSPKTLEGLKLMLTEESGFKTKVTEYAQRANEADETWSFIERGIPCISFTIPIQGKDDAWHRIQQDNSIDYEKIKLCVEGLKRIICWAV